MVCQRKLFSQGYWYSLSKLLRQKQTICRREIVARINCSSEKIVCQRLDVSPAVSCSPASTAHLLHRHHHGDEHIVFGLRVAADVQLLNLEAFHAPHTLHTGNEAVEARALVESWCRVRLSWMERLKRSCQLECQVVPRCMHCRRFGGLQRSV